MLGFKKSGTQKLKSAWPQRIAKIILWTLIAFLMIRGVGSILRPDPAVTIKETLAELEKDKNYTYITEKEAEAFAVMFANEYMTYTGNNDDYQRRLKAFSNMELSGNYTDRIEAVSGEAFKAEWIGKDLINVDVRVKVKYTVKEQIEQIQNPATLTPVSNPDKVIYDNVYLRVPVEVNNKKYLVNDLPVFIPAPEKAEHIDKKNESKEITGEQKKAITAVIESFLTSYCSGNSVEITYFMADTKAKINGLSKRYAYKKMLDGNKVREIGPNRYFLSCQYEVTDSVNNQVFRQGMEFIIVSNNDRYLIEKFDTKLDLSNLNNQNK